MSKEKVFAKGIRTFAKNANAPDFILGTIVISLNELFTWAKENEQYLSDYNGTKQLKLQVLKGSDKLNIQVDTYKKA